MVPSSMTPVGSRLRAHPAVKLTCENFLYWQEQVLRALCVVRVMGLLDGSDRAPKESVEFEHDNNKKFMMPNLAYDTRVTWDQQVVSYLVNSLAEDEHATDVWSAQQSVLHPVEDPGFHHACGASQT
jgi:hypothetical protein